MNPDNYIAHKRSLSAYLCLAAVLLGGCLNPATTTGGKGGDGSIAGDGGTDSIDDGGLPGSVPFEPVGPEVYVPKVKNLLTGLPATNEEVQAVVQDPTALRGLIDGWMTAPEFQARMMDFFRNAFQQNQVVSAFQVATSYGEGSLNKVSVAAAYQARFLRSLMDSFSQTAWELVKEGRPFNETLTTNRFMLTTAIMTHIAYLDERMTTDTNQTQDRLTQRQPLAGFRLDPKSTATLGQTLNPADPNYMIWHNPVTIPAGCTATPPVVYTNATAGDKGSANYRTLYSFINGTGAPYLPCYPTGTNTPEFAPQLTDADWSDWHMVTIHPTDTTTPNTTPVFWDIIKARTATDAYYHIPHIGFSGTSAFAANWGTNESNEMRVTANQSLIVGIGQSIDGENVVSAFPVNATDSMHASDVACKSCHEQLDPMKQFFRQSYTIFYHDQLDPMQIAAPANFAIDGVTATGSGIGDLMTILATHPRYPLAWAQKLQFWATSTPADESDPELVHIAAAFKQSNYDFKTLVREVFSSPLVTLAAVTQTTAKQGVILSIARRDQYCAALSNRLGLPDACGMQTPKPTLAQQNIGNRAVLMPVDTYYRAYALPSLPTNPDLFFRSSTEAMCGVIADQLIDVKTGTSKWTSTAAPAAITDFVAIIMDLPTADARSAMAIKILTDHFTAASGTTGVSATDALKSTFTLACISPSSVLIGL